MTPFGARLRALRAERGLSLRAMAEALGISAAYLSALEHGRRAAPGAGRVQQINALFHLYGDEAEELERLAALSHPRPRLDVAGLTPEQTALANRLARRLATLPPETIAAIHALLDAAGAAKPRPDQRAGQA